MQQMCHRIEKHNFCFFPGKVLQATDRRKVTFLDVLIECDQKMVVSNAAVSLIVIIEFNATLIEELIECDQKMVNEVVNFRINNQQWGY